MFLIHLYFEIVHLLNKFSISAKTFCKICILTFNFSFFVSFLFIFGHVKRTDFIFVFYFTRSKEENLKRLYTCMRYIGSREVTNVVDCYRQCGGCSRHHFRAVDSHEFRAAARRERLRLGYQEPRRWRN